MSAMRLILTTSDSGAGSLRQTGLADIVIPFGFRFVWGPLPSDADLVSSLSRGSPQPDGTIDLWLKNAYRKYFGEIAGNGIGLIDLCERCETIELWIDPDPNSVDLAVGPFAPARKDCSEADIGPGGRGHRQSPAGRGGHMAVAGHHDPERSSRSRQHGLAGLSPADAAGVVQPARRGP